MEEEKPTGMMFLGEAPAKEPDKERVEAASEQEEIQEIVQEETVIDTAESMTDKDAQENISGEQGTTDPVEHPETHHHTTNAGRSNRRPHTQVPSGKSNYAGVKPRGAEGGWIVALVGIAGILLIVAIILFLRHGSADQKIATENASENVTTADTVPDEEMASTETANEFELTENAEPEDAVSTAQDEEEDESDKDNQDTASSDHDEEEDAASDEDTIDEEEEDADDGQILPHSSDHRITEKDLKGLTDAEIQTAINEIYARHGYTFRNEDILARFKEYDWYEPTVAADNFKESVFSDIERDNIDLMKDKIR